jgi:tetratricopeptide (TPR) repeat protein
VAKFSDATIDDKVVAKPLKPRVYSIRVSPTGYFSALFVSVFLSGLAIDSDYTLFGLSLFVFAWATFPLLALTDKISFDGENVKRTGLLPNIWAAMNDESLSLKLAEIEQIETTALRALKRGGNIFYRYQTSVSGDGLKFVFASGGENYRTLVKQLFGKVDENVLDNRSLELRQYINEPKEILMKAEFAKIPSSEVLENSLENFTNKSVKRCNFAFVEEDQEKVDYLRQLANELRLSGYLLRSLEVFRRALLINPNDAWLLFEFSRCLSSYAGAERNAKLEHRANAALRLAELRNNKDGELFSRIGESYFQFGAFERAKLSFNKALSTTEESFRSARGLAEIALREGKIAHVIHHFGHAIRSTEINALKIWAEGETDYFRRLNTDDNYMDAEVQRINWLESMQKHRGMAIRIGILSFAIIILGVFLEESLIKNIGWAISAVCFLVWTILTFGRSVFAERIPLDLFDEDNDDDL